MPVTAGIAAGAGGAGAAGAAGASGASGAAGAGGGMMNSLGGVSGKLSGLGSIGALALGTGQMIAGLIGRNKAMKSVPSAVDPMMQSNLANIRRRRRMMETGTDMASQTAANRQMLRSVGQQYATGGRMNMGVLAQIMSQMGQNARASASDINQMYALEGQAVDTMAQRKSDINMYKAAQRMAWAEQSKSAGQDNLLAALGMGGLKGDKDAG